MKKKKILAIALVVAVLAIVSIASLAWFTDTDEVTNVFTFGEVSITMHDEDGEGNPFNGEDGLTKQPLLPGVPVDKIVYATNDGNPTLPGNEAYVRAFIGVPEKLDKVLDLTFDTENWTKDSDNYIAEIDGIRYKVYQFTYNTPLEAGQKTSNVLTKVELDEKVDYDHEQDKLFIPTEDGKEIITFEINDLREMKIPVAMQAVQVKGFENAAAAFTAAFDGCPWDEAEAGEPAEVDVKVTDPTQAQNITWTAPENSGFDKLIFNIPTDTFEVPVKAEFEVSMEGNNPCLDIRFVQIDEDGNYVMDGDEPVLVAPDWSKFSIEVHSPYPKVGDESHPYAIIGIDSGNPWTDAMNAYNCCNPWIVTTD